MSLTEQGNAFARSANNYNRADASIRSALVCLDASKTQQHHKEQADINTIVKNFGVTGRVPAQIRAPILADFDGPLDYRMMQDALREAQASFAALPAKVRNRFANDPLAFVEFCSDAANAEELRALGLTVEVKRVAAEDRSSGTGAGEQAPAPASGGG